MSGAPTPSATLLPPDPEAAVVGESRSTERLKPYVPLLVVDWLRSTPSATHRELEASLVFVDISGFTALTERLSKKGKVGAELMRDTLDGVFKALLDEAYDWGAGLLKWGGDALLLLFSGPGHEARACRAAWEMQRTIDHVGRLSVSGGTIVLRMSVGIGTGTFHFFMTGSVHRELLIAGPAMSETLEIEGIADAGEIGISHELAAKLDAACVGPAKEKALLLANPPDAARERAPDVGDVRGLDIASCIPVAARAHVLLEKSEPEHRTITAAFIDMMDTDRLLEEIGPEGLARGLNERMCAIQEAALRYEVPFYESDVGKSSVKALLTAGAPSSTGHDEERMLRTLREVMEEPGVVPMRIGVNTGKVFTGDFGPPYRRAYRVFGDAINTAARVMSKAEAGQILSTEIVLNRSRTLFDTVPIAPFAAKGKAEPVRASIVGPIAGVKEQQRGEMPLVGRDGELRAVLEVVEQARSGIGSIVDITGASGLGKSRLVEEVIARCPDLRTLHTRCEEYESSTPYFAMRAVMRDVLGVDAETHTDVVTGRLREKVGEVEPRLLEWLPLLAVMLGIDLPHTDATEALDERFLRDKLAEVAMTFLELCLTGSPVMLVAEDVHFIDEASKDLLLRLSTAGADKRQILLVTHRETDIPLAPDDAQDVSSLALCLLPLTSNAVRNLVELATDDAPLPPHDVDQIIRRSGGNPLFLFELLSAVRETGSVETLPDSVESLIAGEIDRLSPTDRTVLRYAAVLGASFDPEILTAAVSQEVDLDREVWSRLSELVRPEPSGLLRFRNTLIRDAAYEGLPYRRRRFLHERIGDTIEGREGFSIDEEIGTLALHYYEAQRWDKAWDYCRRAGNRAMGIYANVEAARFFERAVAAGRRRRSIASAEVAEVCEALGDVRVRLGEFGRAKEALRAARVRSASSPLDVGRVLVKESRIAERQGSYPQALRTVTRGLLALDGVDGREADTERARLCERYAWVRFRQNRLRDAVTWCERAETYAESAQAHEALARAHVIHDIALFMLGDVSMKYHEQAVAIFEEVGARGSMANALSNLGNAAYEQSDWNRALDLYKRAQATWETTGDRFSAALPMYNIGEILSDQGRYDEAEVLLRDVLRVWRASGAGPEVADVTRQLGRLEARRGHFAEALALLGAARADHERRGEQLEIIATDARIAECLVFSGATDESLALSLDGMARARSIEGGVSALALLMCVRGWALVQSDALGDAEIAFREALQLARQRAFDFEAATALEGLTAIGRRRREPVDEIEAERAEIIEHLGIVATPTVPLAARYSTLLEPA